MYHTFMHYLSCFINHPSHFSDVDQYYQTIDVHHACKVKLWSIEIHSGFIKFIWEQCQIADEEVGSGSFRLLLSKWTEVIIWILLHIWRVYLIIMSTVLFFWDITLKVWHLLIVDTTVSKMKKICHKHLVSVCSLSQLYLYLQYNYLN